MKRSAFIVALCLPFVVDAGQPTAAPTSATSTASATSDRVARWNEDLDYLIAELPAKHKNAFFKCSKENWLKRAEEIRGRIPSLTDVVVYHELRRLVAMLGDGHTLLSVGKQTEGIPVRLLPMAAVVLSDGVFTPMLPKEHEALIGQKLVRIGETPIEAAMKKIAELRASDNESGRIQTVMQDMRDPDALAAAGVVNDPAQVGLTFVDTQGKETTISVAPLPISTDLRGIVAQRPDTSGLPAWQSMRRFAYGHEMLAESGTFYIWYDVCADRPEKTVATFITETIEALNAAIASTDRKKVERVVVDLRRNSGGNSLLFMPMIEQLAKIDLLKQRGRMFGLIGRRTFSSGMMNAYQLRNATGALLVGEATGGSPNGFGEVRVFELPKSKLAVQYSTKLFRGVKEETDAIYPDLTVAPWSKAYFDARDVVMERVVTWR